MEDDISAADLDKLHLEAAEAALEKTRQTLDYVLQGEGFADLLSAGEALLDWARRDLMWKPIETAPRGQWLITYRTGDKRATMAQLGFGDEWISPSGHTTVTSHTYLPPTHWCPLPSPQTNKLPKPLEAFAEALKRVRGE